MTAIILAILSGLLGGLAIGAYLWIGEVPQDRCADCEFWEEGDCTTLGIDTPDEFNCLYYIDKNTGKVEEDK